MERLKPFSEHFRTRISSGESFKFYKIFVCGPSTEMFWYYRELSSLNKWFCNQHDSQGDDFASLREARDVAKENQLHPNRYAIIEFEVKMTDRYDLLTDEELDEYGRE